jgi:4-amino-4-deoxy-L-arabinose transferase-like glycosyltransferase
MLAITFRLARELCGHDRLAGVLAALSAVLSPFFLFSTCGYLSHPLCAVLVAAALLRFVKGTDSLRSISVMYAMTGGAALVRPVTGFALFAVLAAASLYRYRCDKPMTSRLLLVGGVMGLVTIMLFVLYNLYTTGRFFVSGYEQFGHKYCYTYLFKRITDVVRVGLLIHSRWSIQSTMVFTAPFLFFAIGFAVWRDRKLPTLTLAAVIVVLGSSYAIADIESASTWGERYYFEVFPAMCALAARGLCLMNLTDLKIGQIALLTALMAAVQGFVLMPPLFNNLQPHQAMRAKVATLRSGKIVVFLDTNTLVAKHANLNAAEWWDSDALFLPDPGRDRREAVASVVGRLQYVILRIEANQPVLSPIFHVGSGGGPPGGGIHESRCECSL